MTVTKPEDALLTASDSVIIIPDTVRLVEKRRTMVQDSIVERFDLVVFPFAKTDLSDDHRRIIDLVRSRIGQNARVLVEGSTDPLGPAEENAKLSLQRAQNVARELQGNITVIGRGEAPVDPSRMLPEERMFQRVVSIYALVPRTK
jgi:outer membrane protein OmpA-like peptidoglycan-associated protein